MLILPQGVEMECQNISSAWPPVEHRNNFDAFGPGSSAEINLESKQNFFALCITRGNTKSFFVIDQFESLFYIPGELSA